MWEARRAWGGIVNASRSWGMMARDFVNNRTVLSAISEVELDALRRQLIYRHFAWLTALRYQLREPRGWEAASLPHNKEYRAKYSVYEQEVAIAEVLPNFISRAESEWICGTKNKAAQILGLQSKQLAELREAGLIDDFRHIEMERLLVEFYNQQGVCERIKNFPYPRQYATLNLFFIRLFILMLPFGMLQEFGKLGGHLVWLNIPFSALISWIFISMEKIGEVTENPFEGSANDIPITSLSRTIEIDLREMFEETELPPAVQAVHQVLM
jgi:ion channel-forming bestrophin family protein